MYYQIKISMYRNTLKTDDQINHVHIQLFEKRISRQEKIMVMLYKPLNRCTRGFQHIDKL